MKKVLILEDGNERYKFDFRQAVDMSLHRDGN
jgi:hypothetical protein